MRTAPLALFWRRGGRSMTPNTMRAAVGDAEAQTAKPVDAFDALDPAMCAHVRLMGSVAVMVALLGAGATLDAPAAQTMIRDRKSPLSPSMRSTPLCAPTSGLWAALP